MSIYNLDRIFQAKSIAVIGASEKEGSLGATVMQNLIAGGLTVDKEEITPTMKIKRRVVTEKYNDVIDVMYEPAFPNGANHLKNP